jgi:hypothetical protein
MPWRLQMGLDIGIMRITYLDRPGGRAYEFAWDLTVEASVNGYMHGEGNNWGPFTQRQVLEMLEVFSERQALTMPERKEVFEWVRSLPWSGWDDAFEPETADEDNDGGDIELHFNW